MIGLACFKWAFNDGSVVSFPSVAGFRIGSAKLRLAGIAALLMVAVVLVPAAASAGVNEWTSIGPYRASVLAIAIDPSDPGTVYVGTDGAYIFKSTDGGESWIQLVQGLGGAIFSALAIDPQNPNILYAGSQGVFKSIDGGQT